MPTKHRPTGAETTPPRGAAVHITIPGRPQAKDRDHSGRLLDAAKTFMDNVRETAAATTNQPHDGHVRLDLHFTYTAKKPIPLSDWPQTSIPNADTAAALALRALTSVLVHHKSQFNPLTITRTVLTPAESKALYGDRNGATIITWEAEH